ncbi:serine/threonine-protein kinase KIN2 [Apophysomyces sp. BC1034]|nr:serine/threonine-protein kinase KIN2 [Apophysomyces sp. BC1015]KAG0182193.1 serine/threonine-protein kinase KIN2 [Apophysomyces sp. BC1021]KAG0193686.1 serine/threonine-protein kinase KIN2 [Apophysomyces sp. BC1034]
MIPLHRVATRRPNGITADSDVLATLDKEQIPPYVDMTVSRIEDSGHLSNIDPRKESPSVGRRRRATTRPRRVIGNYTLATTLGSGSVGKVKLASHNLTSDQFAVKIVPRQEKRRKECEDENREIRTIREASIMLLLSHPHIVSLKEMVVLDSYYYLFMEYVDGGQMLDYIISHGKLKEKHARRFARQIASALGKFFLFVISFLHPKLVNVFTLLSSDYCHRNSIVHRDLKVENILISRSGQVKIIDFGLSNLFSPRSHLSTFCGSLYFAAPELLNAKKYTGPEVDVWSFGVVLYVLVCGKVPFDDPDMVSLHEKVKRGVVEYPALLSSDCKNLLSKMLLTNPTQRATMSEILVHPWMNRGQDGPVDNYLPERSPLSLPVNMEVIRGMTGFEFGTEAEIKAQLESIINSAEYQSSAKNLERRPSGAQHTHHHHPGSILGRRTYSIPKDDPQTIPAAYHPLISIYYLVKERMQREGRLAPEQAKGTVEPSLLSAQISGQETTVAATNVFPDSSTGGVAGIAYDTKGKTNIRIDDDGRILEADRMRFLESSFQKFFHSRSASQTVEEDEPSSSPKRESGVFRRLSQALYRHSADTQPNRPDRKRHTRNQSMGLDNLSALEPPSTQSEIGKPLSPPDLTCDGMEDRSTRYFNKAGRRHVRASTAVAAASDLPTPVHSNTMPRRSRQATADGDVHLHEQAFPPGFNSAPASSTGTADETIRPVFLKGLFSVSTTSTKHPSVIRADLIRVLERIGVKWRESKGRFECVHMPSIDMNRVLLEDEDDEEEESILRTNAPVAVPDLIVRFEIYIVKVPWLLGMHGIQFRRVGGDSWQYKNMCSKILAVLKL